jgi:hypothetical protein
VTDDVWPLLANDNVTLRSYNGIGFGFKSPTRTDANGRCFVTRWFMVLYLPVIPLGRYYVTQGSTSTRHTGARSRSTTQYTIHGRSRLHVSEILRTYAFQWLLAPAFVVGPIVLLLAYANEINFGLVIGGFFVWLVGSIIALAVLSTVYRRRWAPLCEARMQSVPSRR